MEVVPIERINEGCERARSNRTLRSRSCAWLAALAVLVVLTAPPPALAVPPELDTGTDARLRLALERDATTAPRWFWGWTVGYALAGGTQVALSRYAPERGLRVDARVRAVGAGLGVIGMFISPVGPSVPLPAPDDGPGLKAAVAEQARREREARGWLNHLLCALVATGSASYLLFAEDRPGSAAFTLVSSLLVGEAQIYTTPDAALNANRE